MFKEFREFAVKGNVVDLAVGVIIGAAFGAIVSSLVADIIMPPRRHAARQHGLQGVLRPPQRRARRRRPTRTCAAAKAAHAVTLNYGLFLNAVINFLIVAWAIFLLVRGMNRLRRQEAVAPTVVPVPSAEEALLAEIRDLLKARA